MTAKLQMTTRRRFGISNRAQLNPDLMEALRVSMPGCDVCRDIQKEVDAIPEGGEYVEAPSFPGKTVGALDAHFRFHWKEAYQLVDLSGTYGSPK